MSKPNGLYILDADAYAMVYGPAERASIDRLAHLYAAPQTRNTVELDRSVTRSMEVLFGGWGLPVLDDAFLDQAKNLKAVFYAAGAMGSVLTPAVWERGISISSAIVANSKPVAEYTLATILFSLKHGWRLMRETREQRTFVDRNTGVAGCYRSTVGLISLGAVARELLTLLRPLDLNVIAYDPFVTDNDASMLGVERVGLDELFRRSDVMSLHTPHLPETEDLIGEEHFAAMRVGATFINTARGEVVREDELIAVARRRSDLQFVLDVVSPEPPPSESPLYDLPNVVLTPHIAGSVNTECRRMGRYMTEELERYVNGEPLKWQITPEMARFSSHRPKATWTVLSGKSATRPRSVLVS